MYDELFAIGQKLEHHFKEVQDVEFTIQEGKLWMLQCRAGKRTAKAALKIAVDLVSEGLIDKETAVQRVDPSALDQLLHPTLDPKAAKTKFTNGLAASPGAAIGEAVFTADEAEKLANEGHDVVLVRVETSPEDIHGMHAAKGIVTAGGRRPRHGPSLRRRLRHAAHRLRQEADAGRRQGHQAG
jgi:pyruvate,orthophosphate dikinase